MSRTALLAALLAAPLVGQRVFHTVDEALALAFPGAETARTTEVLSGAECERIAARSGVTAPGRMVFPYLARRDGELVGTAYFDVHRVRTLRETVMVVVGPDGRLRRVLLCAFAEPLDYVPGVAFYAQFAGRVLDDDLRLRRGIDGVTGATLTCRATTDCARRVLAVHGLLAQRGEPEDRPPPDDRGGPPREERADRGRRRP